jgi:hypothetical protein
LTENGAAYRESGRRPHFSRPDVEHAGFSRAAIQGNKNGRSPLGPNKKLEVRMWHGTGASPRFAGWQTLVVFLCLVFAGSAPSASAKSLTLFDQHGMASVVYDKDSGTPIAKAAELLSHDLKALSGLAPVVTPEFAAQGGAIVIGLASSPKIAALLKANNVSTTPIDGKWESYGRAVVPAPWNPGKKVLVIFGSDTRGTIWGVIDLTREMGVSAWEWWADVAIRKVDRIAVDASLRYSKEPSVKYRGFFLNAFGLNTWAKTTFDPAYGGVGPKTYARVFELLWRLKANVLWPEMGGGEKVFNDDMANYELAKDYAIVRGSSHVEMLARVNSHDWDEKTMGPYNWFVNKDRMIAYWREGVKKWGNYDHLWSIGLRNKDDFPMEGAKTPEDTARAVSEAIAAQRQILSEVLRKPADQIPQLFTPYKEITAAYNTGKIDLPKDVIIDWSEDNFGYIMQTSNAEEKKRPGGSGMYYHILFGGAPGSYGWAAATDPTLVWEEMTKAYHHDTRSFWILNVGSIKPCEFLTQFFLELAYDIDAFKDPKTVKAYLHNWAGMTFGREQQEAITDIMWRYYKLSFERYPELMTFSTMWPQSSAQQTKFNMLDFGDENARRASAFEAIMKDADKVMAALPEDRKAAFYQLVQYQVVTGGTMNLIPLNRDKSIVYALQNRASDNLYSERAKAAGDLQAEANRKYNDLENGRWRGFVGELLMHHSFKLPTWQGEKPDRNFCGMQIEGGGYYTGSWWWTPTFPSFHPELGNKSYYLDFFAQDAKDGPWTATPKAPWIKVDRTSGKFSVADKVFEQRINVSVDWSKAPNEGDGVVTIKCGDGEPADVHVRIVPRTPEKDVSFIESQGVVSMYATSTDSKGGAWHVLDDVGHTGAGVLQADLDMAPVDAADGAALAKAPRVEYKFATVPLDRDYSFPNYVLDYTATVRLIGLPVFPIAKEGKLRIAVSVDGGPVQVLDYSNEYYAATWRENVLTNTAVVEIPNLPMKPGRHTLAVTALDPGVTLDRFEVVFKGASPAYGPIPETRIVDRK